MVICLGLFAMVRGSVLLDDKKVDAFKSTVGHMMEQHYTLQDLKDLGKDVVASIAAAPAAVSQAVLDANEKGQYGVPLDEDTDEVVKPVHAVAGGRVLKSGVREDLGMYVTIEHTDNVSTYGQLCNLTMVSGDRVKKGDIIGSYDSDCGCAFYYTLEDKI